MCTYSKTSALIQSICKKLYLLSQNYPEKAVVNGVYSIEADEFFRSKLTIEFAPNPLDKLNFCLWMEIQHPTFDYGHLVCYTNDISLSNLFEICHKLTILEGMMFDCLDLGINFFNELPLLDDDTILIKLRDSMNTDDNSTAIAIEDIIEGINEILIKSIFPIDRLTKTISLKHAPFISYLESEVN